MALNGQTSLRSKEMAAAPENLVKLVGVFVERAMVVNEARRVTFDDVRLPLVHIRTQRSNYLGPIPIGRRIGDYTQPVVTVTQFDETGEKFIRCLASTDGTLFPVVYNQEQTEVVAVASVSLRDKYGYRHELLPRITKNIRPSEHEPFIRSGDGLPYLDPGIISIYSFTNVNWETRGESYAPKFGAELRATLDLASRLATMDPLPRPRQ